MGSGKDKQMMGNNMIGQSKVGMTGQSAIQASQASTPATHTRSLESTNGWGESRKARASR